jgi:hypothetical protein
MKHIWLTILILLMLGCGKSEQEQSRPVAKMPAAVGGILPLKIGNNWIYELYGMDTTSNRMRVFKIDTFSVIGDTLINDSLWYVLDGLGEDSTMARNIENGLWFLRKGRPPFLFAKYPAVLGDKYNTVSEAVELSTEVISTGARINVPAGPFTCFKYQQIVDPPHAINNFYFAPGVGLIKMDILDQAGEKPLVFAALREINIE